jgi:hypothetical protein
MKKAWALAAAVVACGWLADATQAQDGRGKGPVRGAAPQAPGGPGANPNQPPNAQPRGIGLSPDELERLTDELERLRGLNLSDYRTQPVPVTHLEPDRPGRGWHLEWLRWFLPAVLAAACAWGAREAFAKKAPPASAGPQPHGVPPKAPPARVPPSPREEPLGLGADGRGGVWLREVPAWEEEQAPRKDQGHPK